LMNWLPDCAAIDSHSMGEAGRLIRAHVPDFCDV
jgi:hypothetical protein